MKSMRTLAGLTAAALTAVSLAVAGTAGALVIDPLPPQTYKVPNLKVVSTTAKSATIKNTGSVASGAFVVQVSTGYVGDACHWYVNPIVRNVSNLAPGATYTLRLSSEQASEIDRRVKADYGNQVMESNEHDNTGTIPGTDIVC